jgi:predicted amidohydrolase YtcJ
MTGAAELLIVGAPVWTGDPARPWAGAVAVRGGRVAAVGPEREVAAVAGPATRVLRLDGGLVLPGFQDAHVHTAAGGLELARCDLHGVEPEAYAATIARYAADRPDAPWVLGGGWVMDAFGTAGPHAAALDAVVADRPVLLESTDGHSAWVNRRALELAGVTRATPDPPRGRIERDAAGEPTGTLHEAAAMALVADHAPKPTPAEWEAAIERGQAHLHRLGITAWQDAAVGPEMLAAYRALAERGRLTGRAVAALRWLPEDGLTQLPGLVERRAAGTFGRLRASAVKIFADGVFENRTASMLAPYLDGDGRPGGNRGIAMLGAEELAAAVTALDGEGFDVHVHAIGDRAVRDTLDAFAAAAAANGRRDARHQIAHLQFVHPDDRPRFRRLGVVANAQPSWSCLDGYTEVTWL